MERAAVFAVPTPARVTFAFARQWDARLFALAICFVPVSIAITETFLAGALLFRIAAIVRKRARIAVPGVFWFWLVWAGLEVIAWLRSPGLRTGWGEMRHLLLIAALFLLVPALSGVADRIAVWRGLVITASVSSFYLIGHFFFELATYHGPLDPVVYLRGGGLLHHWMIYATVEILVFAGLLELRHYYPEERRWLLIALAVNTVAIVLSLTRTLWICALLVLILHLAWHGSRWLWLTPLIAVGFLALPGAVRSRVIESENAGYYANAERIQMLEVGWRMIREHPLSGVGPGRVEETYTSYLAPGDPVPAYHGHLHNNLVQLAAEFGIPAAVAAAVFVVALGVALYSRNRDDEEPGLQFLRRAALLGLVGFVAAGMFDYTYGHSLGLILCAFVLLYNGAP
ncbi:MAG TPA: O-antigen ligase family protein [Bryobacteraceae bacterium]|nr:O-antigen ligase family protein [Bryobacteraceae bacterium]